MAPLNSENAKSAARAACIAATNACANARWSVQQARRDCMAGKRKSRLRAAICGMLEQVFTPFILRAACTVWPQIAPRGIAAAARQNPHACPPDMSPRRT